MLEPGINVAMRTAVLALVAALATALFGVAAPALAASGPQLSVTGASLMVAGSDQILWSDHGDAELAIASTTKLMTALIVLQHDQNLNQVYAQGDWEDQPGDSQIGLVPGERMTVRDLLVATLVPSADDAAWDLAYNVGGGSVSRFVAMMNAEAKALGLTHTHYTTPTGLDTPGNYSSPDDLVRLADYDMRSYAFFRQTVALRSAQIRIGDHYATVVNTDTLLGEVPWIHGIKTGHTADAGYVLVSTGTRDGFTLIASVLGTDSEYERNLNALDLLDWGFANYRVIDPVHQGEVMGHVAVAYSQRPAAILASTGVRRIAARSAHVQIETKLPRQLSGPLAKGTVVGHARVLVGGKLVADVPLITRSRLPAVSALTKLGHALGRASTLVLLALGIGAAVVLAGRRRRPRTVPARHMEER